MLGAPFAKLAINSSKLGTILGRKNKPCTPVQTQCSTRAVSVQHGQLPDFSNRSFGMDSTPLSFFSSGIQGRPAGSFSAGTIRLGWFHRLRRRLGSWAQVSRKIPGTQATQSKRCEGLEIGPKFHRDSTLIQVGTRFGPSDSSTRGGTARSSPAAPRVQSSADECSTSAG
jgi:hypothetical protein